MCCQGDSIGIVLADFEIVLANSEIVLEGS